MKPLAKIAIGLAGAALVLPVASLACLGFLKERSIDAEHGRLLQTEIAARIAPHGGKVFWLPRRFRGPLLRIYGVIDPAEQQAVLAAAQAACLRIQGLPGARLDFLDGAPFHEGMVQHGERKLAVHSYRC